MWFGVAPRVETKKTYVKKEIRLRAQNMTTISDSTVDNIGEEFVRGQPFNEDNNW